MISLNVNGTRHDVDVSAGQLVLPNSQPIPFEQVLVSTVYDERDQADSASVEAIAAGEEFAHRAAGTALCKLSLGNGQRGHRISFFRWALDGRPGWGSYQTLTRSGQA